ncbi:LysR family transcriptional regulator [Donghicola sp. XS_ASV15]
MENWNDLRICLALHRYGTMSAAASVIGANVATVSRRIHKCERRSNTRPR